LDRDENGVSGIETDGDEQQDENSSDDDSAPYPCFWGLLFFRILYFFNGLSASTWGRFGVIYYNTVKHLSQEQIGILLGINPLIGFVVRPVWGVIADKIQSRKKVYLLCKLFGTCFLLSLAVVNENFWIILVSVVGMALFQSSGVLDAHAIDFLGDKHRGLYGTIRVWTAISWGLGAVIMGYLTDYYGFAVNFWLYGTMSFTMILFVAFSLDARSKTEQATYDDFMAASDSSDHSMPNDGNVQGPQMDRLWKALLKPTVLLWLFEVAIVGAAMSLVDSFLFVYLQNDLHASTVLCGYSVGITVLFELPIFAHSKWLLQKVGHDGLFLTAFSAYVPRVIGYTFLTPSTTHYVLVLEVLHGVTFACAVIASVDYSTAVAPKEWSTTFQSILSTVMACVGGGLGPIIGGRQFFCCTLTCVTCLTPRFCLQVLSCDTMAL
jgi:oligosaccharide:H+ symporter